MRLYFLLIITLCWVSLNGQNDNLLSCLEWREIGPYRGGRSCAVTGVRGKPNLFYFGATGGGVWKTEDGGRSWQNISDGFFGGSIGSIAISSSDPNVIYVGGGEKTVRGNVSFGYGIWKSVDAGKTWHNMGLAEGRQITRIRVHPTNPDIVFAAVLGDLFKSSSARGLYKSIDGGQTWKKVLFANADAGAIDVVIDPGNYRVMYASTWRVRRTPYSLSSGGEGSALWKSTDGGDTWKDISNSKGLPEGVWGISGVSVSGADSDRVFAIIENEKGGLFRSDDGGNTWSLVNDDRALRQRAWYYTQVIADPKDRDVVYVMNVNYHQSNDGGKTFSAKRAPHGDHHDLWIDPDNPSRMIIGDDGGAQVTYDGGETWTTYHNQPTAQFYRVTTDHHFPYRIYAAQQDNSAIRIAHRTTGESITAKDWESTAGGESAHIAVDPTNDDIVYGGSYDGFLTRYDHHKNTVRAINVWPDNPMGHGVEDMKYRFQWNFPIFFSKHNPRKLYTASQYIHVSTNEGQSWEIISPDLTRNEKDKQKSSGGPITQDNTGVEYYCTIFAVSESPLKEGLIWAGSDDGLIHITKDGGKNWENVTPHGIPKYLMINSIEPSPFDEGTCYVAGTMYKTGDYAPYLLVTRDYGKSWKKIISGIDKEHFTRVLRADPVVQGLLYAGTESGVYVSYDDGRSWHSFQLNLPIVPITDMTIKDNNLIVATQGRGLWIIDDLTVVHQAMKIKNNKDFLFKPMPAYRMGGGQVKNPKNAGTNRAPGVLTYFYLNDYDEKKDTLRLVYLSETGDTIRKFSNFAKEKRDKVEVKKGGNLHAWNLSLPPAKKFEGMILWWGSLAGPKVIPGDYEVALSKNNVIVGRESFKVLRRPNSEGTIDDIKKQVAFIKEINDKIDQAHQAIIDIRSLRKQMQAYTEKIEDKDIKKYAQKIDSTMTTVEESLYQTKNRSGQDPLNFPIKLTNKLAHLNSLTQMGNNDFPPTDAAVAVKDELISMIDKELEVWNEVKTDMLPKINEMIRDKKLDVIILKN